MKRDMAPVNTPVALDTILPLTCSRGGTCCHGNKIWLNPWEIANLAAATGVGAVEFCARECDASALALRLDGPPDHRGLPACSQYDPATGCRVHATRPLACRLFPLGRQVNRETAAYMFIGKTFPCLSGCPEVRALPHLSVGDYLAGQDIARHEEAHDAYLEVMQQLAEGALVLLIDSGLAAAGDRNTLRFWKKLATAPPEARADFIGRPWLERLAAPALVANDADPAAFIAAHQALLQEAAQTEFAHLDDTKGLSRASATMMALALHLGRALGAAPRTLVAHWLATAKQHGAQD